jgi:hypothetical protein
MEEAMTQDIIKRGEAYILRTCNADMTSRCEFKWPEAGVVEAPDWKPTTDCGCGLHGFLWGEGDGTLASWDIDAKWIVARVTEWIDLGGKVKFPRAEVVFVGDRKAATDEIIRLGARGAVIGATVTAGYRGTATAGDEGTATAGDEGTATAGYRGTATAGHRGTATAGDEGTATAGDEGTATAGDYGTATAGDYGTATAGYRGIIQIKHWDGSRHRIITGYIGEDGLLPNVPYRLDCNGKFQKA